ncbi:MAG: oligosaccharide flippase family protein, partial [Actinobacteria bacterium]|nr:oligosaccharide flippase family protein [Actinomycetota bacterium]
MQARVKNGWRKEIRFLLKNGFVHIFSANLVNRILQFGISVLIVRLISKETYGSYAYAINILSFFLLLDGLGVSVGVLQFASKAEKESKALSFLKYALKVGTFFNSVLALAILVVTSLIPLPISGSTNILRKLFLVPLVTTIFHSFQSFMRARLMNKQFSVLTVFNTLTFLIFTALLGYFFDVNGIVLARYGAFILSIVLAGYFLKNYLEDFRKTPALGTETKKDFLKFSITVMLTNSISQILYIIDTFLIGIFIRSEKVVASYKTSTLIPFALFFIPLSIMTFAYPYVARNSEKKELIRYYYIKMTKALFILNVIITVSLTVFAPAIIKIVFGSNYLDAVALFRILSFGYLIASTFRIPAGNLIAS